MQYEYDQFLRDIAGIVDEKADTETKATLNNLIDEYRAASCAKAQDRISVKIQTFLKNTRSTMCALAFSALLAFFPAHVSAEVFKSKDFLELPEIQQKGFFDGAISTLYQMAAQKSKQTGQCVHDWYYKDKTAERNWLILDTMKKNPDYRPSVIIAALAESVCGRFVRREKNPQGQS